MRIEIGMGVIMNMDIGIHLDFKIGRGRGRWKEDDENEDEELKKTYQPTRACWLPLEGGLKPKRQRQGQARVGVPTPDVSESQVLAIYISKDDG